MKSHVLIIHGMWSRSDSMAEIASIFEQRGYQVHVPTLPGHDAKADMGSLEQQSLSRLGIKEYLSFLQSIIAEIGKPVLLVGYSMGGLLAQILAQNNQIKGLILIAPAAPAGINAWSWTVLKTFGKNLLKFPLWNSVTELGFKNIQYGIANSHDKQFQANIHALTTYESGRATWQIANWYFYLNSPTKVKTLLISNPILNIYGEIDRITPPKVQLKIAGLYENTETVMIKGGCHWLISGTHLQKVSTTINHWLDKQGL